MGKLSLLLCLVLVAGCGTYNSRNLMEVTGDKMTFSYGLIACRDVDRILILRETNAGKGEAKNNIRDIREYICVPNKEPLVSDIVKEIKDN